MRQRSPGSVAVSAPLASYSLVEVAVAGLVAVLVTVGLVALAARPALVVGFAVVALAVRARRVVTVPLARRLYGHTVAKRRRVPAGE